MTRLRPFRPSAGPRPLAAIGALFLAGSIVHTEPAIPLSIRPGIPLSLPDPDPHPSSSGWISVDLQPPIPAGEPVGIDHDEPHGWHLLMRIPAEGPALLNLLEADPAGATPVGDQGLRAVEAILTPPEAVWEGFIPSAGSRWFRVSLERGDRVWVEAVANRLGTELDPFIRVVAPDGLERAATDDRPGWHADTVAEIHAAAAGEHRIELRDTRHQGGPAHRFRLRFTTTPPMPLPWRLAGIPAPGPDRFSDSLQPGTRLRAGFTDPNQTNRHRVRGIAQQPITLRFDSRRIGAACDPIARLERPDGTHLAVLDPSGNHLGGILQHTFGDEPDAVLVVWEAAGLAGPNMSYEVSATTGPGLDLEVESAVITLDAGNSAEVKVKIVRRGHDHPVRLRMRSGNLPAGLRLRDDVIPPGKREHTFHLEAAPDISTPEVATLQLIGEYGGDQPPTEAIADATSAWRSVWPVLLHPPAPLSDRIIVVLRPAPAGGNGGQTRP